MRYDDVKTEKTTILRKGFRTKKSAEADAKKFGSGKKISFIKEAENNWSWIGTKLS